VARMLVCVCMSMVEGHTLTARTYADYTTHTLREDPDKFWSGARGEGRCQFQPCRRWGSCSWRSRFWTLRELHPSHRFSAAHFVKNL
jgi:hypothetical protein